MKLKVIRGGREKKPEQPQQPKNTENQKSQVMEDYYAKERPRAQDMEQAEGDEDIVDDALKNQDKTKSGNAA